MSFTGVIAGILGPIIRPIIREELAALKQWAFNQSQRLDIYKEVDRETEELIKNAEQATTTEEVWAHLRKLKETRAKLRN